MRSPPDLEWSPDAILPVGRCHHHHALTRVAPTEKAKSHKLYTSMYNWYVKSLSASDFREQCLHLLDDVPSDGILITKRGKPVAKLVRLPASCVELFGTIPDLASDPDDDLFSTGITWDAESRHTHSH